MITGKGFYTWVLDRCEKGDMELLATKAHDYGFTHLIPKISDGFYVYERNEDYLSSLVYHAHKKSIKIIPFCFVYGTYPDLEAKRVLDQLRKYPYDGLVINAEGAYKNRHSQAELFCKIIRDEYPDMLLVLSSYRFPSYHREFPFNEFLKYVDLNMPQVYWMQGDGTVPGQLRQCLSEFRSPGFIQRPILPTGAAFSEHGWVAKPGDVKEFIYQCIQLGFPGCNFWEYYHAYHLHPELGEAINSIPWSVDDEDEEPQPPENVMYVIEMLGNLKIRTGPSVNDEETGSYALRGEVHHATEEKNGWYNIGKGWISGNTQWTRITEVENEPEPDPEPEPVTLESLDERLKRVEKTLYG
jgi:hypothetical protein